MDIERRRFNLLTATIAASPLLTACGSSGPSYAETSSALWRHGRVDSNNAAALQRELVRYATLAPSSHNTQCWKFAVSPGAITIRPDFTRRCAVVDPDDHHLFVSLGCAAENLVQAALAYGLQSESRFNAADQSLQMALTAAPARRTPLFEAIPQRQTTRGDYDGKPLAASELKQLEAVVQGEGVRVLFLTEPRTLETVLDWVIRGNTAQMNDAAFVAELKSWIRYSEAEAVRRGDGLFSKSSGNPTLPDWLGSRLFDFVFKAKSENDKYARHVRSTAGVAVFVGPSNDPAGWIAVGRAYERFALLATTMGVRTAHLNMPIEVASLRADFANAIGVPGQRPDLVIRFGRGPALPPSLRRPVGAVVV
ncbi:MAG: Acg family FMN-binding oxidoreductase [Burkholderiaceae bacterium]